MGSEGLGYTDEYRRERSHLREADRRHADTEFGRPSGSPNKFENSSNKFDKFLNDLDGLEGSPPKYTHLEANAWGSSAYMRSHSTSRSRQGSPRSPSPSPAFRDGMVKPKLPFLKTSSQSRLSGTPPSASPGFINKSLAWKFWSWIKTGRLYSPREDWNTFSIVQEP